MNDHKTRFANLQAWMAIAKSAVFAGTTPPDCPEEFADFKVVNISDDEAAIDIYGVIGWDAEAGRFQSALNEIGTPNIRVRVNSPGGDVFDGRAIYNALRERSRDGANIITQNMGLAASAASTIFLAGDERVAMVGTQTMIHNAMTGAFLFGNAEQLKEQVAEVEKSIGVLGKIDLQLARDYASRTKTPLAEVREMMSEETWLTEDEALEKGFATSVPDDGAADEAPENRTKTYHAVVAEAVNILGSRRSIFAA